MVESKDGVKAARDDDDGDGTADAGSSGDQVVYVTTSDGQQHAITASMLMQLMDQGHLQYGSDSDTDDTSAGHGGAADSGSDSDVVPDEMQWENASYDDGS